MSAHIIFLAPRRQTVIEILKAAQDELQIALVQETDSEAASDLLAVIERLEEVIWRIQGPH